MDIPKTYLKLDVNVELINRFTDKLEIRLIKFLFDEK